VRLLASTEAEGAVAGFLYAHLGDAGIKTKYGSSRAMLLLMVKSYAHPLPDTVNLADETSRSSPRRSDLPSLAPASSDFTFSAGGSTQFFQLLSPFRKSTLQEKGKRKKLVICYAGDPTAPLAAVSASVLLRSCCC